MLALCIWAFFREPPNPDPTFRPSDIKVMVRQRTHVHWFSGVALYTTYASSLHLVWCSQTFVEVLGYGNPFREASGAYFWCWDCSQRLNSLLSDAIRDFSMHRVERSTASCFLTGQKLHNWLLMRASSYNPATFKDSKSSSMTCSTASVCLKRLKALTSIHLLAVGVAETPDLSNEDTDVHILLAMLP